MKKILLAAAVFSAAFISCSKANTVVVMETTAGTVTIELFDSKSPKTVENFLSYVDKGFYDGTIFHRVIKGFMVQGGGFVSLKEEKQTDLPITNEADNGLKNEIGTIAMARTRAVHSATSQFFINTANNDFLDHGVRDYGYCVFGKVIGGLDAVRAIEAGETATVEGVADFPVKPVVILSVHRAKAK